MAFKTIKLSRGKELALGRKHPWIFSGAIDPKTSPLEDGEWVNVLDYRDRFLAFGYVQVGSIAIKVLSFDPVTDVHELLATRLKDAIEYRKTLGFLDDTETTCFRLVFGEGDLLPGLIIDYYEGVCVIQCHSWALYENLDFVTEQLKTLLGDKLSAVYNKSKETMHDEELKNEYLYKSSENLSNIAKEYGNKFLIDWEHGQKTGFFIDQRENRKALGDLAKDKKVLNTFCYTGGFSVYALQQGATLVHSVDVSGRAVELTNENIALNGFDNHEGYKSDIFDFFKNADESYDIIVLDPPAFAKSKKASHNAVQAYKRINKAAMKILNDGGFLFTFSCSQNISAELFTNTVRSAAIECGRNMRIIQHLVQPVDHPVNIYHPEGSYLKGLIIQIS